MVDNHDVDEQLTQPVATPTTWVVAPNERGMTVSIDPTRDELYRQLAERNAENARLRAALEPFANVVVPRGLHGVLRIWDGRGTYPMLMLTTDHLEAARKALEGGTQ